MPQLQLIHLCDHSGTVEENRVTTFDLFYGANATTAGDVVATGINLLQIVEVSDASGATQYFEGIDFNPFRHNRIKWNTALSIGTPYKVTAHYVGRRVVDYVDQPGACEICDGRGWYVNFFGAIVGEARTVSGLDAALQLFLKFLLTVKGSDAFDPTVGTSLLAMERLPSDRRPEVISKVTVAIRDAERQTREYQAISRSAIDESEVLSNVQVLAVDYDELGTTISFSVRFVNALGESKTAGMGV